jgi:hypothetical protein
MKFLSFTLLQYEIELSVNNDRVWMRARDKSTVGRFGHMEIDIHYTVADQLAGIPVCRFCTHQRPAGADWVPFREMSRETWLWFPFMLLTQSC